MKFQIVYTADMGDKVQNFEAEGDEAGLEEYKTFMNGFRYFARGRKYVFRLDRINDDGTRSVISNDLQ